METEWNFLETDPILIIETALNLIKDNLDKIICHSILCLNQTLQLQGQDEQLKLLFAKLAFRSTSDLY